MAINFYQIEKSRSWYLLNNKEDAEEFFSALTLAQAEVEKIYINLQSFCGEYEFWQNQIEFWDCRQVLVCFSAGALFIRRDLAGRFFVCLEEKAALTAWDGCQVDEAMLYMGEISALTESFARKKLEQILPVLPENAENLWMPSESRDEKTGISGLRLLFAGSQFLEIRLAASSLEFYFFSGLVLKEPDLCLRYAEGFAAKGQEIAALPCAEQLLKAEEYSIEDVQSISKDWDHPPFKLSDWQWEETVALLQEFSLAGQRLLSLEPAEQGLLAVKVYQETIGYLPQQGNRRAKYHLAQGKNWLKYLDKEDEIERLRIFLAKNNSNTEEDELREDLTGQAYLELICKAALRRTKAKQMVKAKQQGEK